MAKLRRSGGFDDAGMVGKMPSGRAPGENPTGEPVMKVGPVDSAAGGGGPESGGQGRSQMGPREMFGAAGAGTAATTSRPRVPTPGAGGVDPSGGISTGGPSPFSPMASVGGPMAVSRGLFGRLGGLQGGGLGVPLDPVNDAKSDPISALIKMLQGGGLGKGSF